MARSCDLGAVNPSGVGLECLLERLTLFVGIPYVWIVVGSLSKSLVKIEEQFADSTCHQTFPQGAVESSN